MFRSRDAPSHCPWVCKVMSVLHWGHHSGHLMVSLCSAPPGLHRVSTTARHQPLRPPKADEESRTWDKLQIDFCSFLLSLATNNENWPYMFCGLQSQESWRNQFSEKQTSVTAWLLVCGCWPVIVEGQVPEPDHHLGPPGGQVVPLPRVALQVVQLQHLLPGPRVPSCLGFSVGSAKGSFKNIANFLIFSIIFWIKWSKHASLYPSLKISHDSTWNEFYNFSVKLYQLVCGAIFLHDGEMEILVPGVKLKCQCHN